MTFIHKVSEAYLKEQCHEFDLESISTLSLQKLGINDLGCMSLCLNMVQLDLSSNEISSVMALRTMGSLQILDISDNRLSALSGLEQLESLYTLNAAGNFLSSFDCLLPLTKLDKLHTLTLKNDEQKLTNPIYDVANENGYVIKGVTKLLPKLFCLNGSVLSDEGTKFRTLCTEMNESTQGVKKGSFKVGMRWKSAVIEEPPFVRLGFEKNETYELAKSASDHCEKLGQQMKSVLASMRNEYLA